MRAWTRVAQAAASMAVSASMLAGPAGCSPEVGTRTWCEKLQETPKGAWSTNEAADYAKHCLFE